MAKKDVTKLIERLEVFEERACVRLEAISAFIEDDDGRYTITVFGEVHPTDGTALEHNVELSLGVYDLSGRLVGTTSTHFFSEEFYGFETFQLVRFDVPTSKLSKLRLVPKPVDYLE